MSSNPGTYLLEERNSKFLLYLGVYSSEQGMSILLRDLEIVNISLGTSDYKNLSWATETEFPTFRTSGELLDFLNSNEVWFLTFEVDFKDYGSLKTHDDGECHFELLNKSDVIELIKKSAPEKYSNLILAKLLELPNKYLTVNSNGELQVYHTFDQYLEENQDTKL
ncbi:hypothetical protein [Fulvivirga sp.]|uniref:hypothetical protein n=1 Tax=Fulvivirga sp. TaxID=1931237 RepID=UPI0032EC66C4